MMKIIKFVLSQNTFLWVKNNNGLIYQSENNSAFVFLLSERLSEICRHLLIPDHLYTVELTENDLLNDNVRNFVNQVVEYGAGYVVLDSHKFEKPSVSLMPVLKIIKDINYYVKQHSRNNDEKIIQHIHELSFYINGSEYGDDQYNLQTIYPLNTKLSIECDSIVRFIKNSKNLLLSNINLVGNLFSYPEYNRLINNILEFNIQITIFITANDLCAKKEEMNTAQWHEKIRFHVLLNKTTDIEMLDNLLNSFSIPFKISILVFSEQDCLIINDISTLSNVDVIPIYNGKNIDFFESNIFVNQYDILASALSKREIFMRQATNTNHFGRLTILPDGMVYADPNQNPLGTINDSVYSIVYREFTEGKSWFKIRDYLPCKDCIYQWLCPSPSNYETVIGRPNLCHVKNNN